MGSNELNKVSSYELDILREIGNIGAGNAATALSQILNTRINLEVPVAQFCELTQIPYLLGGADQIRTGVFFGVKGALNGYIFFILEDKHADKLYKLGAMGLDIDRNSVLSEISNIISGAYVNSIATMINEMVDITTPQIGNDMIGALFDSVISELVAVGDRAVYIKTSLTIENEVVPSYYVLLLEQESLIKLLNYFKG